MTQVKLLTDAIDDFIKGCKADGNWDQIKACCIMAAWDGLNGALVPIKGPAPTNFNFVTADYDRKTGLKGNASTKYLDSNRTGSADPQNNTHFALHVTEPMSAGIGFYGANDSNTTTDINGATGIVKISTQAGFSCQSTPEDRVNNQGSTLGLKGVSRENASNYQARTGGVTSVFSRASQPPSTRTYLLYDRNGRVDPLPTNARLSFYSIGESIDLAALDARVSNLMTALDGAIA